MEAVIFVGFQASGKSTYFKEKFADTHVYINMDTLKCRKLEKRLIEECIRDKKSFVADNTNPTIENRAKYIQVAKEAGYHLVCCYFDTPFDECKKRNAAREKPVPMVGMYTTRKKMVVPSCVEGFDEVIVIKCS